MTIINLNDSQAEDKMENVYVSCKDSAKLIRAALKEAFPTTKFSVRSPHYSYVSIRWTDGPTEKQVEAVTNYYKGSSFDGQIDLASNVFQIENGKRVNYGSDYISLTRSHSPLALQMALFTLCDRWGIVLPMNVRVKETEYSRWIEGIGSMYIENANREDLHTLMHRYLWNWVADDFTPKPVVDEYDN